jgi:hypothetical protein
MWMREAILPSVAPTAVCMGPAENPKTNPAHLILDVAGEHISDAADDWSSRQGESRRHSWTILATMSD